ncbi:MAG: alkyldihydroxyacetonephosphate synthase [Thermoleophilaceae bacterium]|nr:alkyldihydroxyacetonephosphate synthase [Thermoleophilaceae bacterium]
MAGAPAERRLKWWGWGYEDQQPAHEEVRQAAAGLRAHLGFEPEDAERPAALESLDLPAPRLAPPAALAEICASDTWSRAAHAHGKAYRDVVRAFRGRVDNPPDVVARPRSEDEVAAVLDWCSDAGAAAIPFGGGTSVVGGVEPRGLGDYAGAVTIDLRHLNRVIEVDHDSRAALIEAGALGPELEDALRPNGYTLRHFPQSFEYSTLGGWIATRAGGHFATLMTHIDDLVESVRALTPAGGVWESRRLPGSGAGPSPDRMLIGSEGILGVITSAWVRVQDRPRFRASAGVRFESFGAGAAAVRALSQSGLHPSNCRLLDPGEAALTGAVGEEGGALLVLGFESADHELAPWLARALELCADHGGTLQGEPRLSGPGDEGGAREGGVGAWRGAFVQAPYLRDTMVAGGVLADTFETAITWDRFDGFVAEVRERAEAALRAECGAGRVTARLTHVYPDGAAPYFTCIAPARRGGEVEQWDTVKAAASEAVIAAGGTITHHHAVGRDHRPWYDRQRPEPFAGALRAAKRAVDPRAVLNPGVLIDP